jgi:hypothetical protein
MPIICPNIHCKNADGGRTNLSSDANYCFVCGRAVSEKAIEKQKREINNLRNRKLSDANNRVQLVENLLSDSERKIKQFEIEFKVLSEDNLILKSKLNNLSDNKDTYIDGKKLENFDIKYLLIGLSILLVSIVFYVLKNFVIQ